MDLKEIISKVEDILTKCSVFSAPIPVVDIARVYGFKVVETDMKESGFILIDNKGFNVNGVSEKKVICVNRKDNAPRKRFTIAHELGHYFIEVEGKSISHYFVHRELRDEKYDSAKERQADLFASELLVPSGLLETEMNKLDSEAAIYEDIPALISKFFGVSYQSAEIRYERYRRMKHGAW